MSRCVWTLFALLAFLCAPCAAHARADDDASELPFVVEKGHVIVKAMIKGDVPVEMILATGAEFSIVDGGLLQKYKLTAYYTNDGPVTGTSLDRTYSFSTVPDIRVGEAKIVSLNMRFGTFGEVSKKIGREIFGSLGADFFKGRTVQFDFVNKVLRFLPEAAAKALKEAPAGAASSRTMLPMAFYKEGTTLPIVESVTYDGKKVKTLLDTGTVAVVSLSPSATKQLGLSPPPEKSQPRAGKVASLKFNDYELTEVPISLVPKGSGFDRDLKEFGAIAGIGLLQNFVITFDFRSKVVVLEQV